MTRPTATLSERLERIGKKLIATTEFSQDAHAVLEAAALLSERATLPEGWKLVPMQILEMHDEFSPMLRVWNEGMAGLCTLSMLWPELVNAAPSKEKS